MIFKRLQARLLLAVGLLALASICAIALSARHFTRVEFLKLQEHQDSPATRQRAFEALTLLRAPCCATADLRKAVRILAPDQAIIVVDEHERVVAAVGLTPATNLQRVQVHAGSEVLEVKATRYNAGVQGEMTLQVRNPPALRVTMQDGHSGFAYVLFMPRTGIEPSAAFLGSVDRGLLLAVVCVAAVALALVWLIARRIATPINALNAAAAAISRGNLAQRVDESGSDEIAELSRTFNSMASELQRHRLLQRHLLQDVSHELRTPLAALQCRLEALLDGMAADPQRDLKGAADDVRHLTRLIDDLEQIASAESRQIELSSYDVHIRDLLDDALRIAGLEHDQRVQRDVESDLIIRADALRTRQVAINLLTNARRYTPAGGSIKVRASRKDDVVSIEVRNTGITLDSDQLARIFDRFYRADPARQRTTGGTGLGLTIVKLLVEAQGGKVYAASDADSVTVGFTLPCAPNCLVGNA